jgi:cysteine desulfurase/selenocysteine lyase
MLNVFKIKKDFPILKRIIHGFPIVYLDNAATTQKPQAVINAISDYYSNHNANIHRGIHTLAEEATQAYEKGREKVKSFIKAKSDKEIIFVRNSTEAINLVAYAWGRENIGRNDEIIVSESEHHSNLVPWQMLASEKKAKLKFIKIDKDGYLDLNNLKTLLNKKTKIVSIVHISNVLGIINPVKEIAELAHAVGAKMLVDGSQSAPRMPIDVYSLGCDFFALTGHKMLGPTGIGVLWGRQEILESMPPFYGGGSMIREVSFDYFIENDLPHRFEAGTPNIAGAVGLGAACGYLEKIGMTNVLEHEKELTEYALCRLSKLSYLTIYGPKETTGKIGVIAFNLEGVHAHDLAQFLDQKGIAVRSGHHCAMPLHKQKLKVAGSCRASFYIYNDKNDIDSLVEGIKEARKVF